MSDDLKHIKLWDELVEEGRRFAASIAEMTQRLTSLRPPDVEPPPLPIETALDLAWDIRNGIDYKGWADKDIAEYLCRQWGKP